MTMSCQVYELGRVFRNEGVSPRHNPEFTSLELYEAYGDFHSMIELTENLVSECAKECCGSTFVSYQGSEIDFTPPWRRVSMNQLVLDQCGVDVLSYGTDLENARAAVNNAFPRLVCIRIRGYGELRRMHLFC